MTPDFTPGTTVRYLRQMPYGHVAAWGCGEYTHYGTVLGTAAGSDGDQVVTVEFDCGSQADIAAGDLQPAGD